MIRNGLIVIGLCIALQSAWAMMAPGQLVLTGPKGHTTTFAPHNNAKYWVMTLKLTPQVIATIHQKPNDMVFKPPYHKMDNFFKNHVMMCVGKKCVKPTWANVYPMNKAKTQYVLVVKKRLQMYQ